MNKKFNKKKLLIFGLPILALALVSAIAYYAVFTVNLNVNQPISVTGDGEIIVPLCGAEDTCLSENPIMVSNSADEAKIVEIVKTHGTDDIVVSYVGKLLLTKKSTTTWQPTGFEEDEIEITYTIVGDTFEYDIISGEIPEGYELVYAMDKEDRFNPGNYATVKTIEEINSEEEGLPMSGDWNADCVGGDDAGEYYCEELNDFYEQYEHCVGAKLWIVKSDNIGAEGILSWANMADYYYETDLVYYFDNVDGRLTIPAQISSTDGFIEFYPAFTPDKYIAEDTYYFRFEVK